MSNKQSNKKFIDLMCIRAGKGFKLGGIYAGVCRKADVWVYGHTDEGGSEAHIVETITQAYGGDEYTIKTSSESAVVFVQCYDYYKGRVTIDLETIYIDEGWA